MTLHLAEPPLPRRILHVDMDAFYASVHQRDDPGLRGRPVIVGGPPKSRGVVCAASYEARKFGIHSAMPSAVAGRLCPHGVFITPEFSRYKAASKQIFAIFREMSDDVEGLSLDEAFIDVSHNKLGFETGREAATHIRARIAAEVGLTASAGVAPNKLVAKIASDYRKPDGLTVVPPARVLEFLHPLPVRRLWGVGPRTAARLEEHGLHKVGDVATCSRTALESAFGRLGGMLWRMSQGIDEREVGGRGRRRSHSAERTFAEDIVDINILESQMARHVQRVCGHLRASATPGRTVVLKLRYSNFDTCTRSLTLPAPTLDPGAVLRAAQTLLDRTQAGVRPVRLLGLGMSGLVSEGELPMQLQLPFAAARAS